MSAVLTPGLSSQHSLVVLLVAEEIGPLEEPSRHRQLLDLHLVVEVPRVCSVVGPQANRLLDTSR